MKLINNLKTKINNLKEKLESKNTIKYSLKTLKVIFIVFAFYMLFFTIITIKNVNNQSKEVFGYKLYLVKSNSMVPEFEAGDLIFIKKIDPSLLKEGDIITYYSNDPNQTIVTHQLKQIANEDGKVYFITQGINVDQADPFPVEDVNVIGIYKFNVPKAGALLNFIKKPIGYILFIFVPILLIFLSNVYKVIKVSRQYKKSKEMEIIQKDKLLELERKKNEQMLEELARLKSNLNVGNNS